MDKDLYDVLRVLGLTSDQCSNISDYINTLLKEEKEKATSARVGLKEIKDLTKEEIRKEFTELADLKLLKKLINLINLNGED